MNILFQTTQVSLCFFFCLFFFTKDEGIPGEWGQGGKVIILFRWVGALVPMKKIKDNYDWRRKIFWGLSNFTTANLGREGWHLNFKTNLFTNSSYRKWVEVAKLPATLDVLASSSSRSFCLLKPRLWEATLPFHYSSSQAGESCWQGEKAHLTCPQCLIPKLLLA